MNKIKIIALFGASASGKDTILKDIVSNPNRDINKIITCTSRPKRDYEKDGIDYYFLTKEEFMKKINNGEMLDVSCFNDWYYGTSIHALSNNKINIGAFSINAIEQLLKDSRIEVSPIHIYADDKTRLLRSLNREAAPNCEEICRRFLADKKDFENINFKYEVYDNSNNNKDFTSFEEKANIKVK